VVKVPWTVLRGESDLLILEPIVFWKERKVWRVWKTLFHGVVQQLACRKTLFCGVGELITRWKTLFRRVNRIVTPRRTLFCGVGKEGRPWKTLFQGVPPEITCRKTLV
jgi:hypothetical protein